MDGSNKAALRACCNNYDALVGTREDESERGRECEGTAEEDRRWEA